MATFEFIINLFTPFLTIWGYWIKLNFFYTGLIFLLWGWDYYSLTKPIFTIRLTILTNPTLADLFLFRLQLRPFLLLRSFAAPQKNWKQFFTSILIYFLGFPISLYRTLTRYYRYANANQIWNPFIVFSETQDRYYQTFYYAAVYIIDGKIYLNCSHTKFTKITVESLETNVKNPIILAQILRDINNIHYSTFKNDDRSTSWSLSYIPGTSVPHYTKQFSHEIHTATSNYKHFPGTSISGSIPALETSRAKNPLLYMHGTLFKISEVGKLKRIPQLEEDAFVAHLLPKTTSKRDNFKRDSW